MKIANIFEHDYIIGYAMTVHSTIGCDFQEVIYQRVLEIEMHLNGLRFERKKEMEIFYRGYKIGTHRAGFFIENCIMLKLKAVMQLEGNHKAQAINYLEAYNMKTGLLINFGAKSLEFKRLYNNRF